MTNPACYVAGCTLAPAFYDNTCRHLAASRSNPRSAYGQAYYDIVPDLLKLTVGARWTQDYKSSIDQIFLVNTPLPVGDDSKGDLGIPCLNEAQAAMPINTGTPVCAQNQRWDGITGNASLDYTPKLDFTDQTLIYASYSRGYKAGGFNPGLSKFAASGSVSIRPISRKASTRYEVGTKNTAAQIRPCRPISTSGITTMKVCRFRKSSTTTRSTST